MLKKNLYGLLKESKRVVWEKMRLENMRVRWGGRYDIKDGVVEHFKTAIENDGDQWFPWNRITQNHNASKPLKTTQNSPIALIPPIITHNTSKSPNKSKTK